MSETRAALRELAALVPVLLRKPALPEISTCRRQADAHAAPEGVDALPPVDVLERLRRELLQACEEPGGAERLAPRTLRQAALVLWNGDPQAGAFPGLLAVLLSRAADRPRWQIDLIEAWLRDFAPDRIGLRESGYAIARFLADATHPRLKPWRDAQARFALFDATEGPRNVGLALLQGSSDVEKLLHDIGMDDPLRAVGGYFRAAVAQTLQRLPDMLRRPAAPQVWQRAVAVLEVVRTARDKRGREMTQGGLRFHDLAGETARACLDPWLSGPPPVAAPKDDIKAFLLRVLGDPRIHRARWSNVGEAPTRLVCRWLAEASLEAFLSLISQTNDDSQWRYRQAFWRACLRKIPSAEVWVVLGPGLADRAKTIRDLAGNFGLMEAGGTYGEQAVLLMRMGSLVLSEWSNVGPVRAWDIGGANCPALYQTQYQNARLRAPSLDFPDHPERGIGGSTQGKGLWHRKNGIWQGCAAALLFNRLQVRLEPKDYMP